MPFFIQNLFLAFLMLISQNQSKEEELVENTVFRYSPAVPKGSIKLLIFFNWVPRNAARAPNFFFYRKDKAKICFIQQDLLHFIVNVFNLVHINTLKTPMTEPGFFFLFKGYCAWSVKGNYNIALVLTLYKSYWAAMNKFFLHARPCVNKDFFHDDVFSCVFSSLFLSTQKSTAMMKNSLEFFWNLASF